MFSEMSREKIRNSKCEARRAKSKCEVRNAKREVEGSAKREIRKGNCRGRRPRRPVITNCITRLLGTSRAPSPTVFFRERDRIAMPTCCIDTSMNANKKK